MAAKAGTPKEAEIQKQCMARLRKMGVMVWRRNVATMMGEYKGKTRVIRAGTKGMSDLWGLLPVDCMRPGLHLEFETKRPGNHPSLDQTLWLRQTNEITGASFWADSPDVVEEVAKALMAGGRVVYHEGNSSFPNPVKGGKGRVLGPNYDYDLEYW